MEFCHNNGLDYTAYTPRAAYFRRDTRRLPQFRSYNERAAASGEPGMPCLFYEAYNPGMIAGEGLLKLFIKNPTEGERRKLQEFLKEFPNLYSNSSEGASLSIMTGEASKSGALRFLCGYLGLNAEDVCCFGDYYNDKEMLLSAGQSVAMGNAPLEVRRSARYCTLPNTQDGVAWFLRRFVITEDRSGTPPKTRR